MCEKVDVCKNRLVYPKIENAEMILKEKCYKRVEEIYGKDLPDEIKNRLELELNSIIKNHFEFVYLHSIELVEKSHELGFSVGARGSVGNSFVAFLLGIIEFNPINYHLPFEIFAGKDYDKEPDIDLNFSREVQRKIHQFLIEKYGEKKAVYLGTVGTISDRTAERMIDDYCNQFHILIEEEQKHNLIYQLCGIKKCTGVHPGGMIIVPEELEIEDYSPIEFGKLNGEKIIKTHCSYHEIPLYKFDILGHDVPTMLHQLEKKTDIKAQDIDLEDRETLDVFCNPDRKVSLDGIPEFETKFANVVIEKANPKTFNDLVCISAISHGTGTWLENAEELLKNDKILIGQVISNRADIFNFLVEKGLDRELAFKITEFIRKGKASNNCWEESWNEYKKIMEEHAVPNWYIQSCEKIKYLFPKSHAINYTMWSFQLLWYKIHYPEAFKEALLEVNKEVAN